MARILVIDDDPLLRRMLTEILQRAGHTVVLAADGLEGAQLYRADPADVVLCDIVMQHSGLALIRILRQQYPECRIIAISGAEPRRLAYARASGATDTLSKPFLPGQLVQTVATVLAMPPESAAPRDNVPV